MSRFRIGQRVRIKWSLGWPELAGHVGTIEQPSVINEPSSPSAGRMGWLVAPDIWGTSDSPFPSRRSGHLGCFCPTEDQLEPLTDSNELVSWESMRDLWVPEHLRVRA